MINLGAYKTNLILIKLKLKNINKRMLNFFSFYFHLLLLAVLLSPGCSINSKANDQDTKNCSNMVTNS